VLNEKVHVRAPTGLPVPEGHVLLLLKAIYGMPQVGREFWKLLRSVILAMGFKQSEFAHCFFFRRTKDGFVIIMTYVDDITITTDNEKLRKEVLSGINAKLKLDDRGVIKSFLGMHEAASSTTRRSSTGISRKVPTSRTCARRWT
jgi:hypothetical protein